LVDTDRTRRYLRQARKKIQPSQDKLIELAGYPINLNSNPQVQAFLGVPSAVKEVLERMTEDGDERAKALTEFRQWNRVISAYYAPFLEILDKNDVLHPNVLLHGTVSGRPSVKKPQVQAIPRYTKVYKVKDIFISRPGRTLISADYSQMELRLGAHYAGDRYLRNAFRKGISVHQHIADIGNVSYDDAKRVNFAVLYGTGAPTLAKTMGISEDDARVFLDEAHIRHPHYRPLYDAIQRFAKRHGYIRMWSGRLRRYKTPSTNRATYKALSNLIQGGVAEVMRYAITGIDAGLVQTGQADMLLQVHDQIILEADDANVPETVAAMQEIMCGFPEFSVPFVAEVKIGKSWGKLKEWKETK